MCALLQFWTDEATTESGDVMYGGRCRPANPMIVRIRATLSPSFGEHFKITWASIAASTSWTQSRLYYGEQDRERFRTEPAQLRIYRTRWKPRSKRDGKGTSRRECSRPWTLSFSTPSWAGAASRPLLLSGQPEARASNGSRQCTFRVHPYQSKDPGRTGSHQV